MMRSLFVRFNRLGLQQRIMLYVTAGLVVFSVIYGFVALEAIQQSTDLVFKERVLVARTIARELDDNLLHVQRDLEDTGIVVSSALAANDPSQAQQSLHSLYMHWNQSNRSDNSYLLLFTDPVGHVLLSEPSNSNLAGKDLTQLSYLRNAFQTQRSVIANGALDDPIRPTALLVTPLYTDTRVIGFLIAEIARLQIEDWLAPSLEAERTGYMAELIDEAGAVIASNIPDNRTLSTAHLQLVAPLWQAGQSGARMHSLPNSGHVIAFAPLAQIRWGVIVEQGVDEALLLPRTLQTQFIVFGFLAVAGGLALAWVTTRTVVRPVNALIHASQEIAHGDLDHPLAMSSGAEIGILARSFDEMRVKLKHSREEIANWNRELEARIQQRTRELTALVESSHALTSTLNLDTLFDILMKETREVLPNAEGIALFLFEPETQTLAVHSTFGFDANECRQLRFHIGEGIGGQVFESQTPALFKATSEVQIAQANLSEENRAHFLRAVGEREVQSTLGVPLVSKGARLGALMLYNFSREAAFAENDVPVLRAVANQAAAAIENARLYAELQQKEALRTQLLEKVIEVQEEEHKRIARDLHDEFAQTLTALTINLQSTAQILPLEMNGLKQRLAETQSLTTQMLKEISQWILELRPTVLDDLGLVPAIRWYAESRLEPVGTRVTVEALRFKHRLPASIETALFRITQEAVTNVAKYAQAHQVYIRLNVGATRISVEVEDDGVGFEVEDALTLKDGIRGLGLLGMRERAALLGGTLAIDSHIGRGTRVSVEVPWKEME